MPNYRVVLEPKPQTMELMAMDERQAEQMAMNLYQLEFEDLTVTEIKE